MLFFQNRCDVLKRAKDYASPRIETIHEDAGSFCSTEARRVQYTRILTGSKEQLFTFFKSFFAFTVAMVSVKIP